MIHNQNFKILLNNIVKRSGGHSACCIRMDHPDLPSLVEKNNLKVAEWLKRGKHGDMDYLERMYFEKSNPWRTFPNAKAMIVIAFTNKWGDEDATHPFPEPNKNSLKGYFSDKNGWIHVVEDQINLINETKNKYPNLNQYMIAHSMGSWIGLAAVQKNINIKGLILSGSSKPPPFLLKIQKALIKTILFFSNKKTVSNFLDDITLGQYNKYFKPNRTPKDWISSESIPRPSSIRDFISSQIGLSKASLCTLSFSDMSVLVFGSRADLKSP